MPPHQSTNLSEPSDSASPSPSSLNEIKLPSPHSPIPFLPSPSPCPSSVSHSSPRSSPAGLIIFDWDDTLLASSYLSSFSVRLDSDLPSHPDYSTFRPQLTQLDRCVFNLLSIALSLTPHVNIITNAEQGWVQLSAAKFLPLTFPLLSHVRVLSARSTYELIYPDSPHKWKYAAFQREVAISGRMAGGEVGCERSVISLGDSHVEREAVRACTRGVVGVRCKSVKFAERSSMEQLRRQVELVTSCFHYIYQHAGDLDLQLTVTVNQPATGGGDQKGLMTTSGEVQVAKEREVKALSECEYDESGDSEMGSEYESEHAMGHARLTAAQMA